MRVGAEGIVISPSQHIVLVGVVLAVGAVATSWSSWRRCRSAAAPVRLAPAFLAASGAALPFPWALVVGGSAALAGRGVGLTGWGSRPAWLALESGLAVIVVQGLSPLLGGAGTVWAVVGLLASLLAVAFAVDALRGKQRARPSGKAAALELATFPAAWLLAREAGHGGLSGLAVAVVVVVTANYALAEMAGALDELRESNDALGARVTELATLHAIGREILATLDPAKVFAIVDRECRKILDVDFFFIGVLDRETNRIRISYRGGGVDPSQETHRPLGEGLAAWVVREKREIRIDDVTDSGHPLPFRPQVVDTEVRSILASPLLVDDTVIGVLSVQSREVAAYDDHQLSVLQTIAQQAAVAVENARHYTMATVDSLTGLYLRDYFFRRLEEEHARARRYDGAFSVLMLDLDGFKDINDRQGHLAGDRYLGALGAVVRSRMRGADLACRYGGDEFCILLPETDLAGARPIAERLRAEVAALAVEVDTATIRTTVSVGVASYPDHATGDLKGLLLRADQALYQAKRTGRDRVVPFAA